MENNNKEKWIKQLKTKLSDYQEPMEEDAWVQMASRLQRSMRVRRWTLAAACVVVLLGLVAGIFRLGTWSIQAVDPLVFVKEPVRVIRLPQEMLSSSLADVTPITMGGHRTSFKVAKETVTEWPDAVLSTPMVEQSVEEAQNVTVAQSQANPAEVDYADGLSDKVPDATWESIEAQIEKLDRAQRGTRTRRYRSSGTGGASARSWTVAVNSAVSQRVDLQSFGGKYNLLAGVGEMRSAVSSMANQDRNGGYMASDGLTFASTEDWLAYANRVGSEQLKNTFNSASVNYDYTHHRPMTFGVALRKGVGNRLSVETGVTATWMRSDITAYDFRWVDGKYVPAQQTNGRRDLWYVGVPLKAGYSFFSKPWLTLYTSAGGTVEKCVSANFEGIKTLVKITPQDIPLQWSVNVVVGAQWNLLPSLALFIDPGVSYFFDNGQVVSTFRTEHPFTFDMNLGLRVML